MQEGSCQQGNFFKKISDCSFHTKAPLYRFHNFERHLARIALAELSTRHGGLANDRVVHKDLSSVHFLVSKGSTVLRAASKFLWNFDSWQNKMTHHQTVYLVPGAPQNLGSPETVSEQSTTGRPSLTAKKSNLRMRCGLWLFLEFESGIFFKKNHRRQISI